MRAVVAIGIVVLGCGRVEKNPPSSGSPAPSASATTELTNQTARKVLAVGSGHGCALRPDGTVVCWKRDQLKPCAVPAAGCGRDGILCGTMDCGQANPKPGQFSVIAAGSSTTCGLRVTGEIECWGLNDHGQADPPRGKFSDVAVGADLACGVEQTTGLAKCWGRNDHGQATPPTDIKLTAVAAASVFACGIDQTAHVRCWGENVGPMPAQRFAQIVARDWTACGITDSRQASCWVGNGQAKISPSGEFHEATILDEDACALDAWGAIKCWGSQQLFADIYEDGKQLVGSPPTSGPQLRLAAGIFGVAALDRLGKLTFLPYAGPASSTPTGTFATSSPAGDK